jgi:hypothetical protein
MFWSFTKEDTARHKQSWHEKGGIYHDLMLQGRRYSCQPRFGSTGLGKEVLEEHLMNERLEKEQKQPRSLGEFM